MARNRKQVPGQAAVGLVPEKLRDVAARAELLQTLGLPVCLLELRYTTVQFLQGQVQMREKARTTRKLGVKGEGKKQLIALINQLNNIRAGLLEERNDIIAARRMGNEEAWSAETALWKCRFSGVLSGLESASKAMAPRLAFRRVLEELRARQPALRFRMVMKDLLNNTELIEARGEPAPKAERAPGGEVTRPDWSVLVEEAELMRKEIRARALKVILMAELLHVTRGNGADSPVLDALLGLSDWLEDGCVFSPGVYKPPPAWRKHRWKFRPRPHPPGWYDLAPLGGRTVDGIG